MCYFLVELGIHFLNNLEKITAWLMSEPYFLRVAKPPTCWVTPALYRLLDPSNLLSMPSETFTSCITNTTYHLNSPQKSTPCLKSDVVLSEEIITLTF